MLKRFALENFSSFKGVNYLDLTAGRAETHQNHYYDFGKIKVLKSAIIYGANASGKSNLIKGIKFSQKIILQGVSNISNYKNYFRLGKDSMKKDTSFEYQIELDNQFYIYGFQINLSNEIISNEWLYRITSNASNELIFDRDEKVIKLSKELISNKKISNRFEVYIEDMKNQPNSLFLSEIAQKDLDFKEIIVFNNLYNWFKTKLYIISPNTIYGELNTINDNKDLSNLYKRYLNIFDTGVIDLNSIEEDFETSMKYFPPELKKDLLKKLKDKNVQAINISGSNGELLSVYKDKKTDEIKVKKIGLIHGRKYQDIFELKDESDGTRRLFDLIPLIDKFQGNDDFTIIIDEFDRSLHPKLTRGYFELFYHLNKSKTQLIVTTHESTLLDLDLVRRDEIWFVEKDEEGASSTFSLNKFKVRYDAQVKKAYLLGRYGAIPLFKEIFNSFPEQEILDDMNFNE
jgi:AAA15 family ATPase/GTPase